VSSVVDFVQTVRTAELLEPLQVEILAEELQPRFSELAGLIVELTSRGWITPYQIEKIRAGRSRELVCGSYILLNPIGAGAMGEVFKARNRLMENEVAIKFFSPAREDQRNRFLREIRAVARLSHRNIVRALHADQVNGRPYLVMEYVQGLDMARRVNGKSPIKPEQACAIIGQAALGLHHAYEQGVVHRDIKPSNLLLTTPCRGGQVKVADFGLALLLEPEQTSVPPDQPLTKTGMLLGTFQYMSPEQGQDPHRVDIRADLYSLGCCFHFFLTGKPPFNGASPGRLLMQHLQEEPPPLERQVEGIPAKLAAIVRKLMAKDPAQRFQTPWELVQAIKEFTPRKKASAPSRPTALQPGPIEAVKKRPATSLLQVFDGPTGFVRSLALSSDGRFLAGASWDRHVYLWKADGSLHHTLDGHGMPAECVAFSPNNASLLSGGGTICLWDVHTGFLKWRIDAPGGSVGALAFSREGKCFLAGESDGTIRLRKTRDGSVVRIYRGHNKPVRKIRFFPSGTQMLSSGDDGSVRVWQFETGVEEKCYVRHTDAVPGAAISPDGRRILSGSLDGDIRIWDCASGQELHLLQGHRAGVTCVAFSPDGGWVLSGGLDGTVRLWDSFTGHACGTFTGHEGKVWDLAVAADNEHTYSCGDDKVVRFWRMHRPREKPSVSAGSLAAIAR